MTELISLLLIGINLSKIPHAFLLMIVQPLLTQAIAPRLLIWLTMKMTHSLVVKVVNIGKYALARRIFLIFRVLTYSKELLQFIQPFLKLFRLHNHFYLIFGLNTTNLWLTLIKQAWIIKLMQSILINGSLTIHILLQLKQNVKCFLLS